MKGIAKKQEPTVTSDDIRSIRVGTSVTFTLRHPKEAQTVRALASYLGSTEPEKGKKYSVSVDYKNRKATVTANPL